MSFEAMTWAVKVLEQYPHWKTPVRFVLVIMANRADEEGVLYPSVRWIMERTKLSESAVRIATRQIQQAGLLLKEKQLRGDGGQSSNIYRLAMSQYVLKLIPPGAPQTGGGAQKTPGHASNTGEGVHSVHPPGAYGAPEDTKELNKRKEVLCPLHADRFDRAWAIYPKRAGNNTRSKAVRAWNANIRAGAAPDAMVAGTERYAAFCKATGKVGLETVMMAATFFGPDKPYEQSWEIPAARPAHSGPPWWTSDDGIRAMAAEVGLTIRAGESWQELKGRINVALEQRAKEPA